MGAWDAGLDHDRRYDLAEEWTIIVKRLWREARVDFEGKYFTFRDCVSEPKPLHPPELLCAGMSPRGFEFSVRHADGCFIGGRDEDETRDASRRAKDIAARLGKPIRTYCMMTVILGDSDAAAEARAEAYRQGLDAGAVTGMLESYGVPVSGDNALTARARGAFMTQMVAGTPATCARHIADFMDRCGIDGLMFIFDDYPAGLRAAGREILPALRDRFA
jgi:pyrimidine oxygenase